MRLAVLCLLAFSASAFSAEKWTRLATPHFELYTTASEKTGRNAILYFEQVRSFFTQSAPVMNGVTEFPVRIILFKSEKEFKPYTISEAAFAYYAPSRTRDYIVMQSADTEHLPAAIHEYMHLIVHHSGLTLPVWLNEGWADVYSTLKPLAGKSMIGDLIPGRVQQLLDEKWLSFDALTTVDQHSPNYNEKNRAGIFYAESWALVHMLYLSPDYKPKFADFVRAIVQGKSAAEACQIAYGKSSAQVYEDLKFYLRRNQLYGVLFPVKLSKSEEEAEMTPVSDFDSDLVLADLLAATNKPDQARDAYEKLAKLNPEKPEIQQSLGYLAWQHGDQAMARADFEKAFAAGDKDPQMCFNLAVLEQQAGQPSDKMIPPLLRALEQRSDYVDARLELGVVELNAQNYDAALAAFVQIRSVLPDRAALLFNGMAYAWAQKGNLVEARKQAINARKWDKTDEENRRTDELIRYIDLRESTQQKKPVEIAAVPPPTDSGTAPVLRRTPPAAPVAAANPFVRPGEKTERVEGTAKSLDCKGDGATIEIQVGQQTLSFAMPDPSKVQLEHNGNDTFDFGCGPQKPFHIAIEYVPTPKADDGVTGAVRKIEF